MKNKTTYEMDDIIALITKDLADKGLALDLGTIEIRAKTVEGDTLGDVGPLREVEIDVNVSWVGIPASDDVAISPSASARLAARKAGTQKTLEVEEDLLDEAPSPRNRPVLAIGDIGEPPGTVEDITTAGVKIARSGGAGPFAPERVKRRLSADETPEWPGNTPPRGR